MERHTFISKPWAYPITFYHCPETNRLFEYRGSTLCRSCLIFVGECRGMNIMHYTNNILDFFPHDTYKNVKYIDLKCLTAQQLALLSSYSTE